MSTQRRLVTLREITHLLRLRGPRYKAYDLATVGGSWTVVVYHGDFKVGDLVLYFEIDSFIPATGGRFSWEDSSCLTEFQGQRGYHVASQMLSKQLSQGLVQPVTALPEVKAVLDDLEAEHGHDEAMRLARAMSFEDVLGVTKWEVPFASRGQVLGRAPRFFPRPACERAQNIPDLFRRPRTLHAVFQVTEKLDGASMTVYRVARGSRWHAALPALPEGSRQEDEYGARVGVASAAEDLDERGGDVYWRAARRVGLPGKLGGIGIGLGNVAVQGELIGPSVKNNSLGFEKDAEHEFLVFQIFDIDKQTYLNAAEVVKWCERLDLPHVPVIGYMRLGEFATSFPELLAKAEGVSMRGTTREGFVFKSMREEEFAFKVISNKWLLEQGE